MASNPRYILGLDPGPEQSAFVVWEPSVARVVKFAVEPNEEILKRLDATAVGFDRGQCDVVIEQIVSMGMVVGKEVFETCYWSGIFAHAYGLDRVHRLPRLAVKLHLCGDSRAKDANIRRALLDRWPAGNKAKPGPLYGIKSHCFAALAVAVTWAETPRLAA